MQNSKQQNIFYVTRKFFLVSIFKVMLKKQTKKFFFIFDVFSFFSAMSSKISDSAIVARKHVSALSKICEKNVKIFGAKINFWPLHEKKDIGKTQTFFISLLSFSFIFNLSLLLACFLFYFFISFSYMYGAILFKKNIQTQWLLIGGFQSYICATIIRVQLITKSRKYFTSKWKFSSTPLTRACSDIRWEEKWRKNMKTHMTNAK